MLANKQANVTYGEWADKKTGHYQEELETFRARVWRRIPAVRSRAAGPAGNCKRNS